MTLKVALFFLPWLVSPVALAAGPVLAVESATGRDHGPGSSAAFEPEFRLVSLTPAPSSPGGEGPPLLRGRQAIVALFSVPVVPLGSALFQETEEPTSAAPPGFSLTTNSQTGVVPGRAFWVTTSAYRFDPDDEWPTDLVVKVTINGSLRSASGQKLTVSSKDGRKLGTSEDTSNMEVEMHTDTLRVAIGSVSSSMARKATDDGWMPLLDDSLDPLGHVMEVPPDGRVRIETNAPLLLRVLQNELPDRLLAIGQKQADGQHRYVSYEAAACDSSTLGSIHGPTWRTRRALSNSKQQTENVSEGGEDAQEVSCVELFFPHKPLATDAVYEVFLQQGIRYGRHSGSSVSKIDSSPKQPSGPSVRFFSAASATTPAFLDPRRYSRIDNEDEEGGKLTGVRRFTFYGTKSRRGNGVAYRRLSLLLPHGLAGEKESDLQSTAAALLQRMQLVNVRTSEVLELRQSLRGKDELLLWCDRLQPKETYRLRVFGNSDTDERAVGVPAVFDNLGMPLESSEIIFTMAVPGSGVDVLRPGNSVWLLEDRDLEEKLGKTDASNDSVPLAVTKPGGAAAEDFVKEETNASYGDVVSYRLEVEPFDDCVERGDARCFRMLYPQWSASSAKVQPEHYGMHYVDRRFSGVGRRVALGGDSSKPESRRAVSSLFLSRFRSHQLFLVTGRSRQRGISSTSREAILLGRMSLAVYYSVYVHPDTRDLAVDFQVLSVKQARPVAGAVIRMYFLSWDSKQPTLLHSKLRPSRDNASETVNRREAMPQVVTGRDGFVSWVAGSGNLRSHGELFATVLVKGSSGHKDQMFVTNLFSIPWTWSSLQNDQWLSGFDEQYAVQASSLHLVLTGDRGSYKPGDDVHLHGTLAVTDPRLCESAGACLVHHALRIKDPAAVRILVGINWKSERLPRRRADGGDERWCSAAVAPMTMFGTFATRFQVPLDASLDMFVHPELRVFRSSRDIDDAAFERRCPEDWAAIATVKLLRVHGGQSYAFKVEDPRPPSIIVTPIVMPPTVRPGGLVVVTGAVRSYGGLPIQRHRVDFLFTFSPAAAKRSWLEGMGMMSPGDGDVAIGHDLHGVSEFVVETRQEDLRAETRDDGTVALEAQHVRTGEDGGFKALLDLSQLFVRPKSDAQADAVPLLWDEGTEVSCSVNVVGLTGEALPPVRSTTVVASADYRLENLKVSMKPVLPGVPFTVAPSVKAYPRVEAGQPPMESTLEVAVLRVDPRRPFGSSWEDLEFFADSWQFQQAPLFPCPMEKLARTRGLNTGTEEAEQARKAQRLLAVLTDGKRDLLELIEHLNGQVTLLTRCSGPVGTLKCGVQLLLDAAQYLFITTLSLGDGKSVRACEMYQPSVRTLVTRDLRLDLRLKEEKVEAGAEAHIMVPNIFRKGSSIRPLTGTSRSDLEGNLSVWWYTPSMEKVSVPFPLGTRDDELLVPIGKVPVDCPGKCRFRVTLAVPLSCTPLPLTSVALSDNALFPRNDRVDLGRLIAPRFGPFYSDSSMTVAVSAPRVTFRVPEQAITTRFVTPTGEHAVAPKPGEKATIQVRLSKADLPSGRIRARVHLAVVDKRYFDLQPVEVPAVAAILEEAADRYLHPGETANSYDDMTGWRAYEYIHTTLERRTRLDPWLSGLDWPSASFRGTYNPLTSINHWTGWGMTDAAFLAHHRTKLTGNFGDSTVSVSGRSTLFAEATAFSEAESGVDGGDVAPKALAMRARAAHGASARGGGDAGASVASSAGQQVLLDSDTPLLLWESVDLKDLGDHQEGSVSFPLPDDSNRYLIRTQAVVEIADKRGQSLLSMLKLWRRAGLATPSRVLFGAWDTEVAVTRMLKLTPYHPLVLRKGDSAQMGAVVQIDETLLGEEVVVLLWQPDKGETDETATRKVVRLERTAMPVTVLFDTDQKPAANRLQVSCLARLRRNALVSHGVTFSVEVTPVSPRLSLTSVWPLSPKLFGKDTETAVTVKEGLRLPTPVVDNVGGLTSSVGLGYSAVILSRISRFLHEEVCPYISAEEALYENGSCTCCSEAHAPTFGHGPHLGALLVTLLSHQLVQQLRVRVSADLEVALKFAEKHLDDYVPADDVFARVGMLRLPVKQYLNGDEHREHIDVPLNLLALEVVAYVGSSRLRKHSPVIREALNQFVRRREAQWERGQRGTSVRPDRATSERVSSHGGLGHVDARPSLDLTEGGAYAGFLSSVGVELVAQMRLVLGADHKFHLQNPMAESALSYSSLLEVATRSLPGKTPGWLLWTLCAGISSSPSSDGVRGDAQTVAREALHAAINNVRVRADSSGYLVSQAGSTTAARNVDNALLVKLGSLLMRQPDSQALPGQRREPAIGYAKVVQMLSKVALYLARGGKAGRDSWEPFRGGRSIGGYWTEWVVVDALASWDSAMENDKADLEVTVDVRSGRKDKDNHNSLELVKGRLGSSGAGGYLESRITWTRLADAGLGYAATAAAADTLESVWRATVGVTARGRGLATVSVMMDFIPDRYRIPPTYMGLLVQKQVVTFDVVKDECGRRPVSVVRQGTKVCVQVTLTTKDDLRGLVVHDMLPSGLELIPRDASAIGISRTASYDMFVPSWWKRCTARYLREAVEWNCPVLTAGTHTQTVVAIANVPGFYTVPMTTAEVPTGSAETGGSGDMNPGGEEERTMLGASGVAKKAFAVVGPDQSTAEDVFFQAGLEPPPSWLMGGTPKSCGACPTGQVCSPASGECIPV